MLPARNVLGASSKDGELNFMPTALPLKAMAKVLETESATETGPRWSRSCSRGPANCGIVTGRRPRSTCTLKLPKGHTQDTHTLVRGRVHELATAAKLHLKFYFHGRG